jgi:hypothetical protein
MICRRERQMRPKSELRVRPSIVCVLVGILGLTSSVRAAAAGRPVEYRGGHPLPKGGYCYIEVDHVHDFPPPNPKLFRVEAGVEVFVGDPVPFGYDGPKQAYYGNHPVEEVWVDDEPAYCYLDGPHYHSQPPDVEIGFTLHGGAYWYIGAYSPGYYAHKRDYVVVNQIYHPIAYARPTVVVSAPPPGFTGIFVAQGPGVAAGVVVSAPAPTVSVGVSAGVSFGAGGAVVAGPPPHGGPPPPPPAYYGGPPGRGKKEWKEKGDNGRHEGWKKKQW